LSTVIKTLSQNHWSWGSWSQEWTLQDERNNSSIHTNTNGFFSGRNVQPFMVVALKIRTFAFIKHTFFFHPWFSYRHSSNSTTCTISSRMHGRQITLRVYTQVYCPQGKKDLGTCALKFMWSTFCLKWWSLIFHHMFINAFN